MNPEVKLQIIAMILQYGPMAIQLIANKLDEKKDITVDDIKELFIDKSPEEYFK